MGHAAHAACDGTRTGIEATVRVGGDGPGKDSNLRPTDYESFPAEPTELARPDPTRFNKRSVRIQPHSPRIAARVAFPTFGARMGHVTAG